MHSWKDLFENTTIPKYVLDKFLIKDDIDPQRFVNNFEYYASVSTKGKTTPSCYHRLDLPQGYPYWFAAAYPEVVRYFANLSEDTLIRLFKELGYSEEDLSDYNNPKLVNKEGDFRAELLLQFKEYYKELYPDKKLECQK